MRTRLLWDLFCRVVDNHGDLGVCWRLARQLGGLGDTVRLWIDEPRALAWMAPEGAGGVRVLRWHEAAAWPAPDDVGDVVVEAFGCDPSPAFVERMRARAVPPVWLNLEYLSAEDYVERCHGLPSPHAASGLMKWFFYPGFAERTGGLLREPRIAGAESGFDARAWLAAHGWGPAEGERTASFFSYPAPSPEAAAARIAPWLMHAATPPTLVLAAPGEARSQLAALPLAPGVRVVPLPWLAHDDFDRLLHACALNIVRGEDSFVRAHWAARPLLWSIYPQHDGAHATKLDAWLDWLLEGAEPPLAERLRAAQRAWNGLGAAPAALPDAGAWAALQRRAAARLRAQADLCTQLRGFAIGRIEGFARQAPPQGPPTGPEGPSGPKWA